MDRSEHLLEPHHLGVSLGASKGFLSLCYFWRKLCTYLASTQSLSPNRPKQDSTWPTSPRSSIVCIQNDFLAYGSTQTVHLSCINFSTISKGTEMSFHLSLITYEYHRVRTKRLVSLWYIQRISCSYLDPTLTLSLNRLEWDSTWPTSPRSSIRCVQTISEPVVRSTQTVHLSFIKMSTISKQTKVSIY
jgi:hypothetical protein